jgi:hypothetical protein
MQFDDIGICAVTHPRCWKMVDASTAPDNSEEIVFSMQGVITLKDLPPIMNRYVLVIKARISCINICGCSPRKPKYIRQAIQLTGLNTAAFAAGIQNIYKIHDIFSRNFPENALQPFAVDHFMEYTCLNLATRYFTSRRDDPYTPAIPIPREIDPNGVLMAVSNNALFFGPDNEVQYYKGNQSRQRNSFCFMRCILIFP